MDWIENKTILTPTGGFLASGFTHTINAYSGCSFAGALCGTFCYAQHNQWITQGRSWALYGAKRNIRDAYRREYDRLKRPRCGEAKPLRIFMSSSTDPYLPQERRLRLTAALLEEMLIQPPDALVIQTHSLLINRDREILKRLAALTELWVSLTIETDMDPVPGFPRHASPPAQRIVTLKMFREAGVPTQATISPLMPLLDPEEFARRLDEACDRVIVDHYLIGDGSGGLRTKRTDFIQRLTRAGFAEWTSLEKMWEVERLFVSVLGRDRVLISCEGFNSVGNGRDAMANLVPLSVGCSC